MSKIFQFLYGTIKTPLIVSEVLQNSAFQFLYGTIKTCSFLKLYLTIQDFNSCMVRLRLVGELTVEAHLVCLFQFLYGTIKTHAFPRLG